MYMYSTGISTRDTLWNFETILLKNTCPKIVLGVHTMASYSEVLPSGTAPWFSLEILYSPVAM